MSQESIKIATGLFVYNRPHHTRQVLEHLREAGCRELHVFCDGPKEGIMGPEMKECRELVSKIDWCITHITTHNRNLGTVQNIVKSVNMMLANHEAVIILEDDCLVRKDFFVFMNACLNKYKDDERVFHVSGYQFPIQVKSDAKYDAYHTTLPLSWGFGLWKRSWKFFRMDINDAADYFKSGEAARIKTIIPSLEYGIHKIITGRLNSFVYRWAFLINKNNGFCISPYKSFVSSIGLDGTGVNCKKTTKFGILDKYWNRPVSRCVENIKLPDDIFRDYYMDEQTKGYFTKSKLIEIFKKIIVITRLFWLMPRKKQSIN